ncbi:hypothetical protein HY637_05640 [Candidatus Woesearchaeota archaeon]|nr:hypothetical protein [Candidatus Woesearchaeota archaeon]
MPETLEQKVSGHETREKKQESELSQFFKGAANTALGAGALGASYAIFGLDGLVTAASFPAGGMIEKRIMKEKHDENKDEHKDKEESKKKLEHEREFTSRHLRNESISGFAFNFPLIYGVNALRKLPQYIGLEGVVNVLGYSIPSSALAVGALSFASTPLFNAIYYPLTYFINNKTFKGAGKDLKEQYKKTLGRSMALSALWGTAVAASVAMPAYSYLLFPVLAGFEVAYRLALSRDKLNYLKLLNPFTYLPKFANPVYIVKGLASLAHRYRAKPATPALAPQPAH